MLDLTPIFQLCRYDLYRLFALHGMAWIIFQLIFLTVEKLIWGEAFVHWGDVALTCSIGGIFGVNAYRMGQQITVEFINTYR